VKRILVEAFVLLLLVMVVAQSGSIVNAAPPASDKVEQSILKLEQAWIDAEKANKPEDATTLFADDAVFTDSSGKSQGKAEELNSFHEVKWETADDSNMKIIQHGNTVIVTGDFNGKGKDMAGKKVEVSERWTDIWMKNAHGDWQIIASQSSPIKK
jgi:ketosteroid isomerase-like protein